MTEQHAYCHLTASEMLRLQRSVLDNFIANQKHSQGPTNTRWHLQVWVPYLAVRTVSEVSYTVSHWTSFRGSQLVDVCAILAFFDGDLGLPSTSVAV